MIQKFDVYVSCTEKVDFWVYWFRADVPEFRKNCLFLYCSCHYGNKCMHIAWLISILIMGSRFMYQKQLSPDIKAFGSNIFTSWILGMLFFFSAMNNLSNWMQPNNYRNSNFIYSYWDALEALPVFREN